MINDFGKYGGLISFISQLTSLIVMQVVMEDITMTRVGRRNPSIKIHRTYDVILSSECQSGVQLEFEYITFKTIIKFHNKIIILNLYKVLMNNSFTQGLISPANTFPIRKPAATTMLRRKAKLSKQSLQQLRMR